MLTLTVLDLSRNSFKGESRWGGQVFELFIPQQGFGHADSASRSTHGDIWFLLGERRNLWCHIEYFSGTRRSSAKAAVPTRCHQQSTLLIPPSRISRTIVYRLENDSMRD